MALDLETFRRAVYCYPTFCDKMGTPAVPLDEICYAILKYDAHGLQNRYFNQKSWQLTFAAWKTLQKALKRANYFAIYPPKDASEKMALLCMTQTRTLLYFISVVPEITKPYDKSFSRVKDLWNNTREITEITKQDDHIAPDTRRLEIYELAFALDGETRRTFYGYSHEPKLFWQGRFLSRYLRLR
ncbi:MAG: hypothetical protein GC129_00955 [Proteobacteria bacterium]|nr:hypothetical protein [Pseudomonadota bacterium]